MEFCGCTYQRLSVACNVIVRIATITRRTALGIPTVQDCAENTGAIFREPLPGKERALRSGLSRPDDEDHAVRKVAQHASVGEMDHRRSVDDDHVELRPDAFQEGGHSRREEKV